MYLYSVGKYTFTAVLSSLGDLDNKMPSGIFVGPYFSLRMPYHYGDLEAKVCFSIFVGF